MRIHNMDKIKLIPLFMHSRKLIHVMKGGTLGPYALKVPTPNLESLQACASWAIDL